MHRGERSRRYGNAPLFLHERVTGQVTEEGISWKTASTDSTFSWDKIIKRRLGPDLLLLYTSMNQALIIPRSYFRSVSDWEAARELVTRNVAA